MWSIKCRGHFSNMEYLCDGNQLPNFLILFLNTKDTSMHTSQTGFSEHPKTQIDELIAKFKQKLPIYKPYSDLRGPSQTAKHGASIDNWLSGQHSILQSNDINTWIQKVHQDIRCLYMRLGVDWAPILPQWGKYRDAGVRQHYNTLPDQFDELSVW